MIFDVYSPDTVQACVADARWQAFRARLLGTSLLVKFERLDEYLTQAAGDADELARRRCRVTNYVHALKRGGLIK